MIFTFASLHIFGIQFLVGRPVQVKENLEDVHTDQVFSQNRGDCSSKSISKESSLKHFQADFPGRAFIGTPMTVFDDTMPSKFFNSITSPDPSFPVRNGFPLSDFPGFPISFPDGFLISFPDRFPISFPYGFPKSFSRFLLNFTGYLPGSSLNFHTFTGNNAVSFADFPASASFPDFRPK